MKSLGKFSVIISIIEDGKVKQDIQKNRTIYKNKDKLFMFWKGNFIPVSQNCEQYFASWENKTVNNSSE